MRLNRFLAQAGCGSRRACDLLIQEGRVTINGASITELATQVNPGDHVKVGNRLLRNEPTITAMLHKPKGYLCTADDPEERKTIFALLPGHWPRVFYVGRLDADSEGLLLITNDGDLSQRLTHPSYKLPKSYDVTLDREFDFTLAPKLLKGLFIEGKRAKFEGIHRLTQSTVKVILTQGIKRQIRLMFLMLGFNVKRLVRTEIGKLHLGDLPVGEWKLLSQREVDRYFGAETLKASPRPPRAARPRKVRTASFGAKPGIRPNSKPGSKPGNGNSAKPFQKSFRPAAAAPAARSSGTYAPRPQSGSGTYAPKRKPTGSRAARPNSPRPAPPQRRGHGRSQ